MASGKTKNLTEGNLWSGILFFSIPLIASNLLQILFNISDIAVVGRFAGSIALGSVGSTTTLVTMFTAFVIGVGNGVNVIVAQAIGKGQQREVKRAVFTSFILSLVIGLLACALAEGTKAWVLTTLSTKEELYAGALLYLRIYFLGIPALGLYNFGSAVYSAAGDTKKPLIYLTVAGLINIALNLYFVIGLHMDVAGVALASIISQYLSAACILISLCKDRSMIGLSFGSWEFDTRIAKAVLPISISAGFTHAIFQLANLFVQYGVNTFDATTVAGAAAAQNADALDYDVMAAFYTACASYIGQNFGAGRLDRVKKTYHISLIYSFLVGIGIGVTLYLLGRPFLGLFTRDPAVIETGMYRLSVMALSYGFSAFMDDTIAASRGLGKSVIPTIIVLMGSCVFRIIWIFTVFAYFHTIQSLYLLYIFSWSITAIAEYIYYRRVYRHSCKIVSGEQAPAI